MPACKVERKVWQNNTCLFRTLLELAHHTALQKQCAFLFPPSSMFSDIMLVTWSCLWRESIYTREISKWYSLGLFSSLCIASCWTFSAHYCLQYTLIFLFHFISFKKNAGFWPLNWFYSQLMIDNSLQLKTGLVHPLHFADEHSKRLKFKVI